MSKRCIDLVIVLAAALPILLICGGIAVFIALTSGRPILYWARRMGANEREFWMPKFRTMRRDTPEVATHLLQDPERWIAPGGKFLRKSSLDELPQLWSVLRGQMSIVGPRPALHNQVDLIAARRQAGINALRPGVTGWAQVNGRDELPIPEKVAYDRQYLLRQSFAFDLSIILRTVTHVLQGRGVDH